MRILFMGSGEISLPTLQWLIDSSAEQVVGVVTQPDKPVGRHQVLTPPAPKKMASAAHIPVFQPEKIRDPKFIEILRELAPDFIIVMAYGQILPKSLLELPKIACLNLHASLLPRHRGASPIQSAILAGDQESGITLMHMGVGLDTGDIVLKMEIPIRADETAGELHDRLAVLGPVVLAQGLAQFALSKATRIPQDPSLVTISRKLDRESGRINWNLPAAEIERHIRAMNPWPGAHTFLPEGKKLKVHRARLIDQRGKPGEVLPFDLHHLVIGTGHLALSLEEIQREGKSRMDAVDFLRGNTLRAGETLS